MEVHSKAGWCCCGGCSCNVIGGQCVENVGKPSSGVVKANVGALEGLVEKVPFAGDGKNAGADAIERRAGGEHAGFGEWEH